MGDPRSEVRDDGPTLEAEDEDFGRWKKGSAEEEVILEVDRETESGEEPGVRTRESFRWESNLWERVRSSS